MTEITIDTDKLDPFDLLSLQEMTGVDSSKVKAVLLTRVDLTTQQFGLVHNLTECNISEVIVTRVPIIPLPFARQIETRITYRSRCSFHNITSCKDSRTESKPTR
jgi:hypothetical protein